MASKKTNHQSVKTLEEAVESFITDVERRIKEKELSRHRSVASMEDTIGASLDKLKAAFVAHVGRAPEVPRMKYESKMSPDGRETEISERHESYGLVSISRVQGGGRRMFGTSVKHSNYFMLRILRGKRVVKSYGEHFWDDGRIPIVEISLSPAQFVEMITTQNIGSGVPCTITAVEGVSMDQPPEGEGNEIEVIANLFASRLDEVNKSMSKHNKNLSELLQKKTFIKEDKAKIQKIVHDATRLLNDSAPFVLKMMGEHTEKLIARGKTELDALTTLVLMKAGIKSIKDNNGQLILGSGDEDNEDRG